MHWIPVQSDDPPNTLQAVTQTSPNGVNLRYYISPPGDEDWFRFEVIQTGSLQVHLISMPANYDLFVYDAAGQLLGSSTPAEHHLLLSAIEQVNGTTSGLCQILQRFYNPIIPT